MYLMNFQKRFMYEVVKNVNQANRAPIYTMVPDFKIDRENNNIIY